MSVTATARAAIMDGGTAGLLSVAGGTVRVALFRNGVECSGNGYSRKSVSAFGAADNGEHSTAAAGADVTFSAVGGSIVFDQVKVYNRRGTVLLGTTPRTTARTIAPGGPATVTISFQIPARQMQPGDAELFGATPTFPGGDTITDAQAVLNSAAFQSYFDGGYRDTRAPAGTAGRRWPVGPSIDTRMIAGLAFTTTGHGGYYAEDQYGDPDLDEELQDNGGPATGFIAVGDDYIGDPVLISRGRGADYGVLNGWGNWTQSDPALLPALDRRRVFIEVYGRDTLGRMPSGKFQMSGHYSGFETVVKTLATPFEDNADQFDFGRIEAHYCDRFFWSTNKQTLGARCRYFDQYNTPDGFLFERGGKFRLDTISMQDGAERGLVIRGNGTNIIGGFRINEAYMDGTSPGDALLVDIEGVGGYCAPFTTIDYIDIDAATTGRTASPLIRSVNNFGHININEIGGTGCGYAGLLHVEGGTADFPIKIIIRNGAWRFGTVLDGSPTAIRNLFTSTSAAYIDLYFEGSNYEINGGTGHGNEGRYYDEYIEKIQITSGTSTVTIL